MLFAPYAPMLCRPDCRGEFDTDRGDRAGEPFGARGNRPLLRMYVKPLAVFAML